MVPDDPMWLCRRLRVTPDEFNAVILPVINEFFSKKSGMIFQRRLLREFEDVLRKTERRKSAGKRSGLSRRMKSLADSAEQKGISYPTKAEHARQARARASQGEGSHRLEVSSAAGPAIALAVVNGQLIDNDETPFG